MKTSWRQPLDQKRFIRLLVLLVLIVVAGWNIRPVDAVGAQSSPPLRVHFIDVGQADSILVQMPDGTTALIDGGNNDGKAAAYLQHVGITHIDVLIATHLHADHIGGFPGVMQKFPVGQVWTSGASTTTGAFENFLDTIAAKKIPYHEAKVGDTIPLGSARLDVLYSVSKAKDLNNTSLVTHLTYGTVSFLFTGDAQSDAETHMLGSVATRLPSTVLKVGHHGSHTSSTMPFLQAVQPHVAVYSAGKGNSYGHPAPETIAHLLAVGATVYGTDIHGTVVITTDGKDYQVTTDRNVAPIVSEAPVIRSTAVPGQPAKAAPTATLRYDPNGPDRDCKDFKTHAEAQAFYLAAGGPAHDRHRLDGDHDGIACESLP